MKRKFTGFGGKKQVAVVRYKKSTYWPMIYCINEKMPIGICRIKANGNIKVNKSQWTPELSDFLDGYRIDMDKFSVGDKVLCPHCGGVVDFRMWLSDTVPQLIPLKKLGDENDKRDRSNQPSTDTAQDSNA